MKKTANKTSYNKEILKFYKAAKKEFGRDMCIDIDGEILTGDYNGLCSFVSEKDASFFKQDAGSQYREVKEDIHKELLKINEKSQYGDTYVWFPTNEYRLKFINNQIKKYQRRIDKQ